MASNRKSEQLQVRVSRADKAIIRDSAKAAGQDVSTYVLDRLLPNPAKIFAEAVAALSSSERPSFALAEISTLLSQWTASELRAGVAAAPKGVLSAFLANYIAAMVESACVRRAIPPPDWVADVPPLPDPVFGSSLNSLRLYLLTRSPPPFRRRNIYIDASVGARV